MIPEIKAKDVRDRIEGLRREKAKVEGFLFRHHLWRLKERVARFIVDHLPPRIVYFTLIRAWVFGTSGKYSSTDVTEVTCSKIIKRWEKQVKGDV